MRRSRKPFRAVSSDEGSNPSPSASQAVSRASMGVSASLSAPAPLPPATAWNRSTGSSTGTRLVGWKPDEFVVPRPDDGGQDFGRVGRRVSAEQLDAGVSAKLKVGV